MCMCTCVIVRPSKQLLNLSCYKAHRVTMSRELKHNELVFFDQAVAPSERDYTTLVYVYIYQRCALAHDL